MYFDDFSAGYEFTIPPAVIEKERMIDFALRYDNIPLHTDEEYAKTTHFGKLIAPGMMSFLEVWAKYLEVDLFGEELIAGRSTKIEWHKPVFAEDILSGKGKIISLTDRNERNGLITVSIDIFNQDGVQVMSSVTEAVVKKRRREQL